MLLHDLVINELYTAYNKKPIPSLEDFAKALMASEHIAVVSAHDMTDALHLIEKLRARLEQDFPLHYQLPKEDRELLELCDELNCRKTLQPYRDKNAIPPKELPKK